ncbi:MAG: hypothetical protein MUP73_05945, partial [Dehalococcoidia bacterium]|nr:hypothetical protein [Dehalococcoidia bacterium]
KCGGSSVRNALSNWFYILKDYRPSITEDEETKIFLRNRIDITRLKTRHSTKDCGMPYCTNCGY